MSYKKLLRNASLDEVAMGLTSRRWSESWFGVVAAAVVAEEVVKIVVWGGSDGGSGGGGGGGGSGGQYNGC